MKHYIEYLFLSLGLSLVGCSSDKNGPVDADPYPAQIAIKVVDTAGNDLFSEDYAGCVDKENIAQSITYEYGGKTYPLNYDLKQDCPEVESDKVPNLYVFHGLYLPESWGGPVSGPMLFGEFDGGENQHEKVIINWPDGTSNTVEFKSEALRSLTTTEISVDGSPWQKTFEVTFIK